MNEEEEKGTEPIEIPHDAIIVRQSMWAWLWTAVPWTVFWGFSLLVDLFTFGGLPLLLAVIFVLPRYMRWRKTAYILTNEYLVVMLGSSKRSQQFDLPFSQISDIQVRPGFFGRSLGYASVLLTSKNGEVSALSYVPERSPLVEHIQARIDTASPPESESEG